MDMTIEGYEPAGSDSQNELLRKNFMDIYTENLERQLSLIRIGDNDNDVVEEFLTGQMNYPYMDRLETLEIYADPNHTPEMKEDLAAFENVLESCFEKYWGIRLTDGDIYLYYCLYKTLHLMFSRYFIYFMNGLQKLNENYMDEFVNYQEYTFNYFLENVKKTKIDEIQPEMKFPLVSEYAGYIIELGIPSELYFQIALEESEGDVFLSYLFTETANNRIVFDNDFFNLKIRKLMETYEADMIINDLANLI